MKNKIVLITGATSGIGKATAMALAKAGAHVVIHGRSKEKTDNVKREIIAACGHQQVDTLIADLLLMKEVRRMAAEFNSRYAHVDVLINNAGSMMSINRETTAEGHEKTIAVNLLAPFLLTALIKKNKDTRIINVASSAHKDAAKPDFNDIELNDGYTPLRAYGNAKLFLILFTQRLARKGIIANSMHPGAVASNFSVESNLGPVLNVISKIARLFFISAEKGADTLIYLAKEVYDIKGQYFINRKPAMVAAKHNTIRNEEIIWRYCETQTGVIFTD